MENYVMGSYTGTAGADVIDRSGSGTADTVSGLDGNDTITGSSFSDLLLGNQGNDIIVSGSGADTVYGGFGADFIFGNQDNDVIFGNEDGDTVYGGLGNDQVDGGTGDDNITGNEGNDTLLGGDGNDFLFGNQDNDFMGGQVGNDSMYGGLGDDTVIGGQGDDQVFGNEGNDQLYGNEGNDLITGGDGYDITNFSGNYLDYAFGKDSSGRLIVTDTRGTNGNEGHDTITVDTETMHFADADVNVPGLASTTGAAGSRNVYVIGDSISEGGNDLSSTTGDIAYSWPSVLDSLRSGSVYNAAISGAVATAAGKSTATASTQSVAGDVWDSGGNHTSVGGGSAIASYVGGGHGGDVAIIMIGRNDISGGFHNNGGTYNEANVIAAIDDMVNDARANGNHFLVSSVLLRSNEGTNGYDPYQSPADANPENRPIGRAEVLSLNAALSAKYGDAFVDTNAAMIAANPSGDGTIASSFFTDTLHPTTGGQSQIGNFMAAQLDARGW